MIALLGLLRMVLRQQAVDVTKRHLAPRAHTLSKHDRSSAKGFVLLTGRR